MPIPKMNVEEQQAYDEALRRIEECRRKGKQGTGLILSNLGLTTLPPEIGKLTVLTTLVLFNNQLTTLPPELGQLMELTELYLYHNRLTTLPPELGQLKALTYLNLSYNQLAMVPPELGQLTALTTFYLSENPLPTLPPKIGQLTALTKLGLSNNRFTTLPPEIGQLTALTKLYLSDNHLTTLPPEIGQLTALTKLHLYGNQLTTLPPEIGQLTALRLLNLSGNQLTTLPSEIGQVTALAEFYLQDNPKLGIPAEVLGPTWSEVANGKAKPKPPREILDWYFRNRAAAVKRPILEAKVILVGWGEVGKTSLRRRLVDGSFDAKEKQTHKIQITPWPVTVRRDKVKLHIWDFGGQEIMHATHQFFLTKRSLYVLVLAGREKVQGAQEAEYWLRLIASVGGGSPVLVVLNKQHGCPFDLNRQSLVEKYPFIRGFVQTDCDPPLGLEELQEKILAEVDRLPELRTEFDARWMAIKDAVKDLKRKGRRRMAVGDYRKLCVREKEEDEKWQGWLLGFLHDLGVVVCFHEDERLANDGVLDPQWVVDGIYSVLNEPKLKGGDGQVTPAQVRALLPAADYADDDVRVLLEMMEKFELCFRPQGTRGLLVVPELMTEQEAEWRAVFPELEKCLRFELKYEFLPEGLVPRFIVATHDLSQAGERWRSGVILRQGKNVALVRGDAVAGRVSIAVNGPEPTRRDLLAVIRRDFRTINASIMGLVVKERVPVPGKPHLEPLDYEKLLVRERNGRTTVEVEDGEEVLELPLAALLDGIETRAERQGRDTEQRTDARGDTLIFQPGSNPKIMRDDKSIHARDITNSQVGQTLTNCTNTIQQQAPGERRDLLEKLDQQVRQLLAALPAEKHEEVSGNLDLAVKAVTSAKPNRKWYSVSTEGLLEASKYVKDFSGNLAGTIKNLGKLVWPDLYQTEGKK